MRRAEQLRDSIRGSELQIVKGAGHMVHYLATRQVVRAVESVAEAALAKSQVDQGAEERSRSWTPSRLADALTA